MSFVKVPAYKSIDRWEGECLSCPFKPRGFCLSKIFCRLSFAAMARQPTMNRSAQSHGAIKGLVFGEVALSFHIAPVITYDSRKWLSVLTLFSDSESRWNGELLVKLSASKRSDVPFCSCTRSNSNHRCFWGYTYDYVYWFEVTPYKILAVLFLRCTPHPAPKKGLRAKDTSQRACPVVQTGVKVGHRPIVAPILELWSSRCLL